MTPACNKIRAGDEASFEANFIIPDNFRQSSAVLARCCAAEQSNEENTNLEDGGVKFSEI